MILIYTSKYDKGVPTISTLRLKVVNPEVEVWILIRDSVD